MSRSLALALLAALLFPASAFSNSTYQPLPFAQAWTNTFPGSWASGATA